MYMAVQKIYSIVGIGDIFSVSAVRGPLVIQMIPNLMGMLVVLNDDFIYHSGARCPEAEFLDVVGTKVLRVFLLAIHSQL